jgi:hypothetical protein
MAAGVEGKVLLQAFGLENQAEGKAYPDKGEGLCEIDRRFLRETKVIDHPARQEAAKDGVTIEYERLCDDPIQMKQDA